MSHNTTPPSGIGLVSLFTVLMVLCISVFSVLSLVSARADWRITQRNAEAVTDYYVADAAAAQAAATLADRLWPAGTERPDSHTVASGLETICHLTAQVTARGDGLTVTFSLPVDDLRRMDIEISMPQGGQCQFLSRKLVIQEGAEPAPDNSLPVWTG